MTNFTKAQLTETYKAIHLAMRDALDRMQNELAGAELQGSSLDLAQASFTIAKCTYDGGEATYKIKVLLDGAETKEQKDLTKMASLFNLDTTKIKNYIDHRSVLYRMSLVGYKTRARKMPWIAQDLLTGNEYKLTNQQARQWFMKVEEIVS
tara:strand:+ start:256 stop:708 length:453 start_codon:yes stop_codon:yes gene_type:complete